MHKLMAELMYGSGVRVKECCRTRVKDVDLERLQLGVRGGKGDQDRVTVLPRRLVDRLREQIDRVRRLHDDDSVIPPRAAAWHNERPCVERSACGPQTWEP